MDKFIFCLVGMLFISASLASDVEESDCTFLKNSMSKDTIYSAAAEMVVEEKLTSSSSSHECWVISHNGQPIVIPVDNYKQVVFMPDEKSGKLEQIWILGDSYRISFGGISSHLNRLGKRVGFREGLMFKPEDVSCMGLNDDENVRILSGIALKKNNHC